MIQVEKHGNAYPFWRCTCPKCECQFTFNHNDTFIKSYNDGFCQTVYCPECGCDIDEMYWDT